MVPSSSTRPVRSAAHALARLSGLVRDDTGVLTASVLSRVLVAQHRAGAALPDDDHEVVRAAAAGMRRTIAVTAETLVLVVESAADELGAVIRPAGSPSHRAPVPHIRLTAEQAHAIGYYTTVEGVEELNTFLRGPAGEPADGTAGRPAGNPPGHQPRSPADGPPGHQPGGPAGHTLGRPADDLPGHRRSHPAGRRAELRRLVDHAVRGLAALPRYTGIAYRGTSLPASQLARWRPGVIVADRGFASASASQSVAEVFRGGGNAFLTIVGRSGADIRALSSFEHEAEVLYPPGTPFRIVDRAWDDHRECWSFLLEEVTPCASTAPSTTG